MAQASNVPCGTSGTLSVRIEDCIKKSGKKYPDLTLIVRTTKGSAVWLYEPTQQLWSANLGENLKDLTSYCRAQGLRGFQLMRWLNCDPAKENDYDLMNAQSDPPESWCKEQKKFATPERFSDNKGGLSLRSTPAVQWHLPTTSDWRLITKAFEAMPPANEVNPPPLELSWSDSLFSYYLHSFFFRVLAQRGDAKDSMPPFLVKQVRCVGRLN
jgi:hypothetical protein